MAKFVVLAGFTDQGIRNVKETVSRAEAFKEMAKKSGVTVKDMYWTLGRYDVIANPGLMTRSVETSGGLDHGPHSRRADGPIRPHPLF